MKLKHYDYGGHARFITFCTHNQIPVLNNNIFFDIIISAIKATKELHNFKLIGYVLMPEHIHLVMIPEDNQPAGKIIGKIKELSSIEIHKVLETENPESIKLFTVIRNRKERFAFWQRRCFDYNCRSESLMWEKVDYCHNNPVTRGLVKLQGEWRYSSFNWYNGQTDVKLEMDRLP